MGRPMRHMGLSHSPAVRSVIKPVRNLVPAAPAPAALAAAAARAPASPATALSSPPPTSSDRNPYLPDDSLDRDPEVDVAFLIPTQPAAADSSSGTLAAGTSDVKGKKRAREQDGAADEEVEYDAAKGTRFGVQVAHWEENLPKELEKYWAQRYRLFSLFDEGCQMDREGWYSVTPENIAAQIAERCRSGVVLDAFCGVGGNAIQFAFTCERVIALDTSPVRLACAAHNAAVYGVADRITFILADWLTWTEDYLARRDRREVREEDLIEVVFLSPPWGGIEYQRLGEKGPKNAEGATTTPEERPPPTKRARVEPAAAGTTPTKGERRPAAPAEILPPAPATAAALAVANADASPTLTPRTEAAASEAPAPVPTNASPAAYPLSALAPLHGRALFDLARRITPHVAYYLPRNVDLLEVADLVGADAGAVDDGDDAVRERERIEIEEEWMSGKLKAVTAYFGELAAPLE